MRAVLAPALATPTSPAAHRAIATGHAHIDTAWLWPIRETVRKCVRTFASAVALMDDEPDFVFSCSQAQQYEWVREREPELFERIAAKVAAGQWVPVGGMWVEADMNLPSGESIARQIVHGQRWFAEHFGVTCTEVWIPDVFGYPGSLPQIFAAGGMRRFVTQKLSWNSTNRFPHQTFWWEGIDGSRVLTHFPPVDTYGAEITPAELSESMERFAEHAWSDVSLIPYGYGDGGGGPTREMLARAARLADLDPMPHVELGSAARFFEHVEAEAAAGAPVPVWRGELYFETHRGTLTSQLRTKLGNRRCERLLREAELWTATAALGGAEVDPHELDETWREVLTQQFHDILPGSSIAWVHADAEEVFDRVAADLEQRIAERLADACAERRGRGQRGDVRPCRGRRHRGAAAGRRARRNGSPTGARRRSSRRPVSGWRRSRPPCSGRRRWSCAAGRRHRPLDGQRPARRQLGARRHARRRSSTSPAGRELIPAGAVAAELLLAPDHPVQYDAWDLESWTVDASAPVGPRRVDRRRGRRPARRDRRREAVVRPVVGRRPLRPARRVAAPRRRDRARLAARRAPPVDALPGRCPRRHRDVRHPVRRRAPADPRLDDVGRRQVRGVRPPLRRCRRARLRRRRAQQRALRPRSVRAAPSGSASPGRRSTPTPTPTAATTP